LGTTARSASPIAQTSAIGSSLRRNLRCGPSRRLQQGRQFVPEISTFMFAPAGISVQVEHHNTGTQDTERTEGCTDLSWKRLSWHETRCSECPELTQPDVDQNFAKINRFVAKASIGPYKYRKPRIAASNPRLRYGVVRSQSR
jgi:hypothetical protein